MLNSLPPFNPETTPHLQAIQGYLSDPPSHPVTVATVVSDTFNTIWGLPPLPPSQSTSQTGMLNVNNLAAKLAACIDNLPNKLEHSTEQRNLLEKFKKQSIINRICQLAQKKLEALNKGRKPPEVFFHHKKSYLLSPLKLHLFVDRTSQQVRFYVKLKPTPSEIKKNGSFKEFSKALNIVFSPDTEPEVKWVARLSCRKHISKAAEERNKLKLFKTASHVCRLLDATRYFSKNKSTGKKTIEKIVMYQDLYDNDLFNFLRHRRVDKKDVPDMFEDLLHGLQEVHNARLLHNDLKPANIFINTLPSLYHTTKKYHLYLGDLGLADYYQPTLSRKVDNGTYITCSPERLIETKMLNSQTLLQPTCVGFGPEVDIWSLGCIFHQLYSGQYVPWYYLLLKMTMSLTNINTIRNIMAAHASKTATTQPEGRELVSQKLADKAQNLIQLINALDPKLLCILFQNKSATNAFCSLYDDFSKEIASAKPLISASPCFAQAVIDHLQQILQALQQKLAATFMELARTPQSGIEGVSLNDTDSHLRAIIHKMLRFQPNQRATIQECQSMLELYRQSSIDQSRRLSPQLSDHLQTQNFPDTPQEHADEPPRKKQRVGEQHLF